jgi:histidine triad (HIT) family protein
MEECIFCKIIGKEIPADVIYEDEHVIAFHDINPAAPVHVLVIPKNHIEKVADIDEPKSSIISKIFLAANKIAEMMGIKDSGFRVAVNNGIDAGQVVYHLHFHVIGGNKLKNI